MRSTFSQISKFAASAGGWSFARFVSFKRVCLIVLLITSCGRLFAQNAEEEKIKQVVRAETDAYYKSDADAWQATWSHSPKATRTFIASYNYATAIGWDKFGPDQIKNIKEYGKPIPATYQCDNYIIQNDGKIAWVDYDQHTTTTFQDSVYNQTSRESRLLLKENGQWKIVTQVTTQTESFGNNEANLNAVGYNFLTAKKVDEAIAVFKLNVQLFPGSWNTYDSLGEAYAAAGNKDEAIKNYEKSIAMNPKNDNGKTMLAKLKQ